LLLGDGVEGGQGAFAAVGGEGLGAQLLGGDQGFGGFLELLGFQDAAQGRDRDGVLAADVQGGDAGVEEVVEQVVREFVCVHGPKVASGGGGARRNAPMSTKHRTDVDIGRSFLNAEGAEITRRPRRRM
jgi:hypothetical protein